MSPRFYIAAILFALGIAGAPSAQAQTDTARTTAMVEGSWYLRLDTAERSARYLEIVGVQPGQPGHFSASAIFGWADGPISPVTADIAANGATFNLSLTASTGATLSLRFDTAGGRGSYTVPGQPPHNVSASRLNDRPEYGSLVGAWRAKRGNETRVFDIKQVLGTGDGAIIAIGQYGVAERPDEVRQLVATVAGSPAKAELTWMTGSSAARLQRTAKTKLTGTFEADRKGSARVEPIVFRSPVSPATPPKQKVAIGGQPGQLYPDFKLVTMDGRTVQLSDFRGKVVIVNMFQSWCFWCIDEMSAFRAAKLRYSDKVTILPVLYGVTDAGTLKTSERSKRYGIEIYGTATPPVGFRGTPTNWLLDRDGMVIRQTKYLQPQALFDELDKATAR